MTLQIEDSTAPTALYLWRVLRFYIEQACQMFGTPSALAQRIWLSPAEHRLIAAALRLLEKLLRRLIFLQAVAAPPEPILAPAETKRRPRRGMPVTFGVSFDVEDSSTWRASFKCNACVDRPRARGQRREAASPLINAVSAAPLAMRFEALIRAFNEPSKFARHMIRTMLAEPQTSVRVLAPLARQDRTHPFAQSVLQADALCVALFKRADSS